MQASAISYQKLSLGTYSSSQLSYPHYEVHKIFSLFPKTKEFLPHPIENCFQKILLHKKLPKG
ncbi:hypothetical protein LYNGBM3L_00560 [Moorena producens 3L]|uniref:Uncharacterized protein n=2 Tax=Moorena producens TaxID=1155739 RepID=A0A1D9G0S7_MOOP1|nr:hypothetical protein LYNGBM3L_00560 [Moorena producens 3L]OLT65950.1 hypothetical protein BI334_13770 [Moorena producens 3L]